MPLAMGTEAQAEIDSLRERLAAAEAVAAEVARIKAINADLEARNALLELQNEKMRRTLFGQRSERTRHLLDQMELTFEECETAASEDELLAALAAAKTNVAPFERKRPARKPLPEHLPRERVVIAAPETCPCCGSDRLCKLGEDITETLEVVPRQVAGNAGMDPTDVLNKLRMKHAHGGKWYGVDVIENGICDTMESFVWEATIMKRNALAAATEAA